MSLSPAYKEIKQLRSKGDCASAIAKLRGRPPASDEDAFEAAVCLFICGDLDSAVNVCRTYAWKKQWARQISQALSDTIVGTPDSPALSLARAAVTNTGAPYDAAAIYLLVLQKNGLVDEAEAHIASHLQDPPPGENFLLTMMAEIAVATENWREAYRLACTVLSSDPDDYRALVALSVANFKIGNLHEALGNANRANMLNAGLPQAIVQIMRCQNSLGDYYAAIAAFDKLADKTVIAPDIHVELGTAHSGLEDQSRAITEYRAALASGARSMEAIRKLMEIYAVAGDRAALEALAETYPAEIRRDRECVSWLAVESLSRRDLDGAARLLRDAFACYVDSRAVLHDLPWPVPEPRLRHDCEQLALLDRRGRLDGAGRAALNVLQRYCDQPEDLRTTFAPAGAEAQALRNALCTIYHVPDPAFTEPALGANDYGAIAEKYLAERLVVIDDFLSPRALSALRGFCEEATVWKHYNKHGYTGAMLAQGFSPKVLLAISDELRQALPGVIDNQPLLQAWAFKYDQRMQGINLHADFARVNVNFWITPDEACEDPASGGMVVYDLPVPRSWTFHQYNSESERLAAFLRVHEAKPVRVPYRANRCVLFDSSLIHASDEMHFRPGYENRRINVTLLYGKARSVG